MAIDETKLQEIIDEQQNRIEALEKFCVYVAMGMLMVMTVTTHVAIETGVIEEVEDKEKVDAAMTEYLRTHTAGNA